jgi:hypothetical protein
VPSQFQHSLRSGSTLVLSSLISPSYSSERRWM